MCTRKEEAMSRQTRSEVATATPRRRKLLVALAVVTVVAGLVGAVLTLRARGDTAPPAASATLRLPDGKTVGRADVFPGRPGSVIRVTVTLPAGSTATGAFHGFHIHANDNARNGNGCMADPAAPAKDWFVSADGHFTKSSHSHPDHDGDMTSLYVAKDGRATLEFRTDRIAPSELIRRAIVIHAGPDNFGNVPTGAGAQNYTANSPAATETTERTGNAGNRIACGIIEGR
jgi:superoxide dismutase, Cu-Zn family